MKPRKPDRFARMVREEQQRDDWGIAVVSVEDVIKLLRKEHAWMRRMVRRCLKGATDTGYVIACSNILGQLDQWRK